MIFGEPEFDKILVKIIKENYRHPLYDLTCQMARDMRVHLYGDKPIHLLNRARPREEEEVKQYRIDNYEATTKAPSGKAVKIISKIFNPSLSSIRWANKSDQIEKLKQYTLEYFPDYNSLINFNKDVALRKTLADANGLMAVKPRSIPKSATETIKPIIIIYGSESIWNYDYEHYLIFISTYIDNKQQYHTFEYHDFKQYLKFDVAILPDNRIQYNILEEYTHNFIDRDGNPEIPAWKLRGVPVSLNNGEIIYESFFADALPHWNLSIIHESDVIGAYITHMHPQKYELAEECDYKLPLNDVSYPCRGGKISYPWNDQKISIDCPKCSGTGYTSVKSPYGAYQFSKEKLDDGTSAGILPVGYISIPTDATKMLEERADRMIDRGMWAINMDVEDSVGEIQSGVAKQIDRSAQYDTLSDISTTFFDVNLQNQFYFINKYMFQTEANSMNKDASKNLPEINKPTQFDISSVGELLNNFKVAKESGLDRNFLSIKQSEILTRDLSTNPDLKKYSFALLDLDPLPGLSSDDIDLAISRRFISQQAAIIHFNIKPFVDKAISENANFLSLNKEQQLAKLTEYADKLISENKPKVDTTIINQMNGAGQSSQPGRISNTGGQ